MWWRGKNSTTVRSVSREKATKETRKVRPADVHDVQPLELLLA